MEETKAIEQRNLGQSSVLLRVKHIIIATTFKFQISSKPYQIYLKSAKLTTIAKYSLTCLREIGNVNLPETSSVRTISLEMIRQLRQTPAQATTLFLSGHEASDSSILIKISLRSSEGILAQPLCSRSSLGSGAEVSCTTGRERDLISRKNLLRDMDWPDICWRRR